MSEKQEKNVMIWPFIKQLAFSTEVIFLSIFCVPWIFSRRLNKLQLSSFFSLSFFFFNTKELLLILQNVCLKEKQKQKEVGSGKRCLSVPWDWIRIYRIETQPGWWVGQCFPLTSQHNQRMNPMNSWRASLKNKKNLAQEPTSLHTEMADFSYF